jgi:hypothetical protein
MTVSCVLFCSAYAPDIYNIPRYASACMSNTHLTTLVFRGEVLAYTIRRAIPLATTKSGKAMLPLLIQAAKNNPATRPLAVRSPYSVALHLVMQSSTVIGPVRGAHSVVWEKRNCGLRLELNALDAVYMGSLAAYI